MTEDEMRARLLQSEAWLETQRKALAHAVSGCKEIVDAIERTEREIAVLKVSIKGAE